MMICLLLLVILCITTISTAFDGIAPTPSVFEMPTEYETIDTPTEPSAFIMATESEMMNTPTESEPMDIPTEPSAFIMATESEMMNTPIESEPMDIPTEPEQFTVLTESDKMDMPVHDLSEKSESEAKMDSTNQGIDEGEDVDDDGGLDDVASYEEEEGEEQEETDVGEEIEFRKVSGKVLEDVDGDNKGDEPIAEVQVSLYSTGAAGFNIAASTKTDETGSFVFTKVKPGKYFVIQSNKQGYIDVANSGEGNSNVITIDVTSVDIEELWFVDEIPSQAPSSRPSNQPSKSQAPSDPVILRSISGVVLEDIDNDDEGDEPLEGVTVILYDSRLKVVASTKTDETGSFTMTNIPQGTYQLFQQNLAGYINVKDSDGGLPSIIALDLTTGDAKNLLFVDEMPSLAPSDAPSDLPSKSPVPSYFPSNTPSISAQPSHLPSRSPSTSVTPSASPTRRPTPSPTSGRTVTGRVKEDIDNDNIGDKPLMGVQISIYNGDNLSLIATTATDEAGAFFYTGLVPGEYVIVESNLEGYVDVLDSDGGQPNLIKVDLKIKDVSDIFFVDELPSMSPSSLPSDLPTLSMVPSLKPSSNPSLSHIPTSSPSSVPSKSPAPSSTPTDGPRATISGQVNEDVDNDGDGDEPMKDVVVVFFDAEGKLIASTKTDETGKFFFDNVIPGIYTVVEQTPLGYHDVSDSDGDEPNSILVDLVKNLSAAGLEFVDEAPSAAPSASPSGVPSESSVPSLKPSLRPSVSSAPSFIPSVSPTLSVAPSASPTQKPTPMPTKDRTIMGSVLEDTDNDDVGDSPIKGVTLVLYDTVTAQPIASTTTSDSGAFAFTGLVPGKYSVVEENLKGFLDVTDSNGGNPNIIEIDLGLSDVKDIFFIDERPSLAPSVSSSPSGTPSLAPSISAIPSAQPSGGVVLGGTVWEDIDNDNKGDEPIPSVVIALWNSDTKTIISTTLTDDSGKFMFTEMKAGNYVLNEITPKGFHDVTDWDQGNPNTISIKMAPGDIRMDLYFVDERPSAAPSERPSAQPTIQPTPDPTGLPTVSPTKKPTGRPTPRPTNKPMQPPTRKPTLHPTNAPAWSAPHFTPVYLPPTARNNPECICIYFDEMTLSRGDFIRDQYLEHYGFEITADGGYSPENYPNSARIFDTLHIDDDGEESDDFLSKHWDQKNVLIIQDIYKEDPADNDSGGVIEIHFKEEVVYMDSVSMLDADFALDEVKLIFKDGSSESVFYADTGNGDYHTVEIQRKDVRKVQIKLAGSGAVADFTYCPNNFEGNLKNLE